MNSGLSSVFFDLEYTLGECQYIVKDELRLLLPRS